MMSVEDLVEDVDVINVADAVSQMPNAVRKHEISLANRTLSFEKFCSLNICKFSLHNPI